MSDLKEIRAIGVTDAENWKQPAAFTYEPQELRPEDVEIKIQACGVCGSDIHAAQGDWGRPYLPIAVGHEIVGIVTAAGEKARFNVGDRVGVGAQCDCCHTCKRCEDGIQNTCKKQVGTYMGVYPSGKPAQGGYASHVRVNSEFAFKIPDNMETNFVAPLLCGGITALRPMMTYGVKKGTRVGINGIGGIGHMAILFAKALGAEVTAISRNNNKKELALSLGADHYIATNEEDFAQKYEDSLDLIVNTAFTFNEGEMDGVLNLLSPFGQLIFITAPPITERLALSPMQMLMSNISVAGSMIGSPSDIEYMLKLASEHNIKPMIETLDISVENVKTAWERMLKNDVKFRFVLTGYEKYFDAQN
jgi:alcohol dehydrogenase (NADP+)